MVVGVETEGVIIDGRPPLELPKEIVVLPDLKEILEGFRVLHQIVKFYNDADVVKAVLFTSFIAPAGYERKIKGIECKHKILYGVAHVGKSKLAKVIAGLHGDLMSSKLIFSGSELTPAQLRRKLDSIGFPVIIDEAYNVLSNKEILEILKSATTGIVDKEKYLSPTKTTTYYFIANLYMTLNKIPDQAKGYEAFFKERVILFHFDESLKKEPKIRGERFWRYIEEQIRKGVVFYVGRLLSGMLHKFGNDKSFAEKVVRIWFEEKYSEDEIKTGQEFMKFIIKEYLDRVVGDITFVVNGTKVKFKASEMYEEIIKSENILRKIKRQAVELWNYGTEINGIKVKGLKNGGKFAGVALLALYTKWIWEEWKYDPEKAKEEEEIDYAEDFVQWFNEYINRMLIKLRMSELVTASLAEKIKALVSTKQFTEFDISGDGLFVRLTKKVFEQYEEERKFEVPWTMEQWAKELQGEFKKAIRIGKKFKRGIEVPVEVFEGKQYE